MVHEVEELTPNVCGAGVSAATELTQRTVYVDVVDLPLARRHERQAETPRTP